MVTPMIIDVKEWTQRLQEAFDQWDAPGLSNDTEFAVFAFALSICLVLVVCKLIASVASELRVVSAGVLQRAAARYSEAPRPVIFLIPPLSLLPLRI